MQLKESDPELLYYLYNVGLNWPMVFLVTLITTVVFACCVPWRAGKRRV